ncbi:hypothetical protein B0H34DRAFT_716542 [Crassisporium funariophilum]|nr:hypothetical protein B0H34DRAFT_716542 [Crassisporium funariophilum]
MYKGIGIDRTSSEQHYPVLESNITMAWPPLEAQDIIDINAVYVNLAHPLYEPIYPARNILPNNYNFDSGLHNQYLPTTLFEFHPAEYIRYWLVDYWSPGNGANVPPGRGNQLHAQYVLANPGAPAPQLLPALLNAMAVPVRGPPNGALHVASEADVIRGIHQSFTGWVEGRINAYYAQYGIDVFSQAEVTAGQGRVDLIWSVTWQNAGAFPQTNSVLVTEFKQPGAVNKANAPGGANNFESIRYQPQAAHPQYKYPAWRAWKAAPNALTNPRFYQALGDNLNNQSLHNNNNACGSTLRQLGYYFGQLPTVQRMLVFDYRKMALFETSRAHAAPNMLMGKGFSFMEDENNGVTFAMFMMAALVAAVEELIHP